MHLLDAVIEDADASALALLRSLDPVTDWNFVIAGICHEGSLPLPVFWQLPAGRPLKPGWERVMVEVAHDDLCRGNRGNADWCPVARAIRRWCKSAILMSTCQGAAILS